MKTQIIKVNPYNPSDSSLSICADALKNGELVAFPTETVYGLGANAFLRSAVEKIYTAKGRPKDNPIIVHVKDIDDVFELVSYLPEKAKMLMERFWPGPLTLLLPKSDKVPDIVTANLPKVAIRMPDHPIAQRLIHLAGVPIAAPSANLSGRPSPVTFEDTFNDLNLKVPFIIDGGQSGIGVESTVLDITSQMPVILRPGGLAKEDLEEVLGKVEIYSGASDKPQSPGVKYRHYSPKAKVMVARGSQDEQRLAVLSYLLRVYLGGIKTLVLSSGENYLKYKSLGEFLNVLELGGKDDLGRVATRLFSSLRYADEIGASLVLSESFPLKGLGLAVEDRLKRASAGRDLLPKKTLNLLFICTGNTCRSPMAEIFLKNACMPSCATDVRSRGIHVYSEGPASFNAQKAAELMGLSLSSHKSGKIRQEDMEWADLVIPMTSNHKDALSKMFPNERMKVYTLKEVLPHFPLEEVPDPFGSGLDKYIEIADILKKAAEELAIFLARWIH